MQCHTRFLRLIILYLCILWHMALFHSLPCAKHLSDKINHLIYSFFVYLKSFFPSSTFPSFFLSIFLVYCLSFLSFLVTFLPPSFSSLLYPFPSSLPFSLFFLSSSSFSPSLTFSFLPFFLPAFLLLFFHSEYSRLATNIFKDYFF